MNKSIKVLSFIALAFSCLGILFAVSALTFLREPLCSFLNYPASIARGDVVVPWGSVVNMVGCLTVSVLLLITSGRGRLPVVEIISVLVMCLILPVCEHYIGNAQTIMVGRYMGSYGIASLSASESMMFLPFGFINISCVFCFLTCGMRIAKKCFLQNHRTAIKVLSVITMVIAGVALLLAVAFLTFLWEPLSRMYISDNSITNGGPVLPVGNMLYITGVLIAAIFLLATCRVRRVIALEIIPLIFLGAVFPLSAWLFGIIQNSMIAPYGVINVAMLSVAKNITGLPLGIAEVVSALCLVMCGIRMALKLNSGNRNSGNVR